MDNKLKKSIKEIFLEYLDMSDEESDILIERINEKLLSKDGEDIELCDEIIEVEEGLQVGDVLKNSSGLWAVTDVDSEGSFLDAQFLEDYLCDNELIYNINGEAKSIRDLLKEREELYLRSHKVHEIDN